MDKHTPIPWRAGDGGSILATWPDGTELQIAAMFHTAWSGNDGGKTRRIQDETPGNRALIIRAVNNHEALLEALALIQSKALAPSMMTDVALKACVKIARAAIARATEGQP